VSNAPPAPPAPPKTDDTSAIDRFVVIGALGDVAAGTDLLAVEPGVPERRVLRRLFSSVGARRAVVERLREDRLSTRAPRILDIANDREGRTCVVLEDAPRMPWEMARPRNTSEAALLALDVLRTVVDALRPADYTRGTIDVDSVHLDQQGAAQLRALWPPRVAHDDHRGEERGPDALVGDVVALITRWGFGPIPLQQQTVHNLEEVLRRMVPHVRPPRWSPPLIGDARRLLDVLTDADQPEKERCVAAYRLACVPSLRDETVSLLVRALNEPLPRLPFVARDVLADRLIPVPLFIDKSTGLLRRCPHDWATTEIVEELGGAALERFCPDCDARVALPQSIETFEGRSAVADSFAQS
jgi:hypothetical protein